MFMNYVGQEGCDFNNWFNSPSLMYVINMQYQYLICGCINIWNNKCSNNSHIIRRVWRYQRGNQNPYIEEKRVSLVEQELLTLPEHLSSPSVLSGVRVTRSLDLYVLESKSYDCISSIVIIMVCPLLKSTRDCQSTHDSNYLASVDIVVTIILAIRLV
jgi:hypothetical protein